MLQPLVTFRGTVLPCPKIGKSVYSGAERSNKIRPNPNLLQDECSFIKNKSQTPTPQSPILSSQRLATLTARQVDSLKIPYTFEVIALKAKQGSSLPTDTEKIEILPPALASKRMRSAKSIVLGDLHASCQKLFETLVVGGFIQMPEPKLKAMHRALAMLERAGHAIDYKINGPPSQTLRVPFDALEKEHASLQYYHKQVLQLLPFMQWIHPTKKLTLVGDVLSDRGPFDPTTLAIVEHIDRQAPGKIIRLAANHDHFSLEYIGQENFHLPAFSQSLRNAVYVAKQTPGGEDRLKDQYFHYLEKSKLFHWEADTKTLYTHAPITRSCLRTALDRLKNNGVKLPAYEDLNATNLPRVIHTLNQAYQDQVVDMAETIPEYRTKESLEREKVFYELVDFRSALMKEKDLAFTKGQHGVEMLVHGHDSSSTKSPFSIQNPNFSPSAALRIVNINNTVRKQGNNSGSSPLVMVEN
jgi:hypothetical protein